MILNLNGSFTSTRIRQGQGLIELYSNKARAPQHCEFLVT